MLEHLTAFAGECQADACLQVLVGRTLHGHLMPGPPHTGAPCARGSLWLTDQYVVLISLPPLTALLLADVPMGHDTEPLNPSHTESQAATTDPLGQNRLAVEVKATCFPSSQASCLLP